MERYSEYKDSGVKWLGEIPSHWEVKRLGKICSFSKGLQFTKADLVEDGVPVVSYGQVHAKYNSRTHMSNDLIRYVPGDIAYGNENSKVGIGDFIVADTSEDVDGCGNMAFNDCRTDLYGGYHTILIKNLQIQNQKFLAYLFNSNTWRAQVRNLVNGVKVYTINRDILKSSYVVMPPNKEQNVIVDYLDSAVSVIDNAIAQQQKMIDLLNERKQIIINDAVTKGLDPKAKMKDSGIERIGRMPSHWNVSVFKHLFNTRTGITFTKEQLSESGAPVISYGQIHSKDNWGASVNPVLIRHIPLSLTKGKESAIARKGDFLFADTSEDFDGCGNNVYVDTEELIYAGYHTILAKCNNKECGQYLAYLFASSKWRGQVRSMVNGVKVYSVTQTILNNALVILPPISEQKEIANYVTKKVVVINEAIDRCKKRIKLLQERKQIIINDVVTGKVKVV